VLADYPGSWDETRALAGLDWDPVTEPVYALAGVTDNGELVYQPIDGWKRITRSDTGATLSLNRDTYTLIDHAEMGQIVEAVLSQPNVKWETAGVLDGGRAVWCLAMLDEPITLPGDTLTMPYLAITNRHDGIGSCALARHGSVDLLRQTASRCPTWKASDTASPSHSCTAPAGGTASTRPARPSPEPAGKCAATPNSPAN
jgi:phage/plasmid-like protein (TIGR03299 family)